MIFGPSREALEEAKKAIEIKHLKVDKVLTIPPQYVGLIIGKGGVTLRRLEMESGARMALEMTGGPNGEPVFFVRGSEESVNKLSAMCNAMVEDDTARLLVCFLLLRCVYVCVCVWLWS